jgi:hypothetical protein
MSDLYLGLIAAGTVLVGGVWGYNAWQEKKYTSKKTSTDITDDDVLMKEDASHTSDPFMSVLNIPQSDFAQPSYSAYDEGIPFNRTPSTASSETHSVQNPAYQNSVHLPPLFSASEAQLNATHNNVNPPLSTPARGMLDNTIDAIVNVRLQRPIGGQKVLDMMQHITRVNNKPVVLEGCLEGDTQWTIPEANRVYDALRWGVLLANRSGALTETDWQTLVPQIQQMIDAVQGEAHWPDAQNVLARARDIDELCAALDIQLVLHVIVPEDHYNFAAIEHLCQQHGMQVPRDGLAVMLNSEGQILFNLTYSKLNPHIQMVFDLPRAPEDVTIFTQFIQLAQTLTAATHGMLVDENHQPITPVVVQQIQQHITARYQQLREANMPAGSLRAQRLFA